jgi:UDP-3-O-[3-hydroxymyristoyl] glucosamine N-acyltransferase
VVTGKHCLIVAQVGISGSTTLEDYVVIGGQAGLTGHLHIGAGAMVGAQSGVIHDLPAKSYVRDSPSMPYMVAQKVHVLKGRLPELFKRVAQLEEVIEQIRPGSVPPRPAGDE